MLFLQSSVEGAPPRHDPWDWSVDQVVYALTDADSPLMDSNRTLSLPDASILATILREQDVNGLALLTLVKDKILREEWGIKSMSQRASILHLARVLQDQSQKYENHIVASGRMSSLGGSSRFSTPYAVSPQQYIPGAATRGFLKAPLEFGGVLQTTAQTDEIVSTPNIAPVDAATALAKSPASSGFPLPDPTGPQFEQDSHVPMVDSVVGGRSDDPLSGIPTKLHYTVCKALDGDPLEESERTLHEPSKRQGETIIVDETGRKRRKLVLVQQESLGPANIQKAADTLPWGNSNLPNTLPRTCDSVEVSEASSITMLKPSLLGDPQVVVDSHESPSTLQEQLIKSPVQVSVPDPGTVLIDGQGRKRLRPILISQPNLDTEEATFLAPTPGEDQKQRSYGRKMKRTPDQLYLGVDSLGVDRIFYGDVGLEKEIEHNWKTHGTIQQDPEDAFENFKILSHGTCSNGQRLYVNYRIRHFLLSPRLLLERDGIEHVGIIPYPERFGKKHYPLSITILSKSRDGITASRSNRSTWIHAGPSPTDPNIDSFNVADPILAQDDKKDSEWAALEKWKYLDGQDDVLPLYGDSGSEGEYELDTWREIEQERGTITRPLRQSKHQKLTNDEVNEAMDDAMKQLIRDWSLKRLPKLQQKAWRIWVKSRRDGDASLQIRLLDLETVKFNDRIYSLRKEIAGEIWSKTSQVAKQCKIIQPSLFDREDNKWRIALLKSTRVPAKPLPMPRKSKVARIPNSPKELKEDEENLATDGETSESPDDDSLNEFVVEDEIEIDHNEAVLGDDDLSMPDPDDNAKSDDPPNHAEENSVYAIQRAKDDRLGLLTEQSIPEPDDLLGKLEDEPIYFENKTPLSLNHRDNGFSEKRHNVPNVIDLTQQSDPLELSDTSVKPEIDYSIRTPPLFDSENDSDVFRRSRGKKAPVFRKPLSVRESSKVIDLDTDSTEAETELAPRALQAYADFDAIGAMDPLELVRQKDRKRLILWMIAHTPTLCRKDIFDYLRYSSFHQSRKDVAAALKFIHGQKKHNLRVMDLPLSESILRIAVWQVCWKIPIKADRLGLKPSHVVATLEDKDGYGPFYDFLLECMDKHPKVQDTPDEILSTKKREKIVQEDSEDAHFSPMRKRKYRVQESQATLDKRRAAQDRLQADGERRRREERRREELKDRFVGVQKEEIDTLGVIVNPGKMEHQDFVYLNPRFGNGVRLRPHQKEGLQFLWREITADHDDLQGCLLAQTMGLGKTMQVIALMVALSEAARSPNPDICQQVPPTLRKSCTLVLCPPALVENWWDEFILWVPQPRSENIGEVRKVSSTLVMTERLDQIYTWSKEGGVLLIGYDAFKGLVLNKPRLAARALIKKPPLDDSEHSRVKEALTGGANLVIADEAHYFKVNSTAINLAMNQIKTKSRIALTGSPLNNNLEEYYTLIDWIAPNYLGTRTEFKATYEEPIREGLYLDSTRSQKRTSMKKLKALELEMGPKVHRASVSVLQNDLKGKSEFVVVVALTELQEQAYNIYVRNMRMASRGNEPHLATLWTWLGVLQLLCNHPKCYWERLHQPRTNKRKSKSTQSEQGVIASEEDATLFNEATSQVALGQIIEESKSIFDNLTQPLEALCLSNKMRVLMQILDYADAAHDKVLVFSHRIATLDYIVDQLAKVSKTYARIDGTLDTNKRQQISKEFNMGKVNICLISTRAGGTGLNFYGANRVVIMDEYFNPTWEQQAIGRAYRIGQQKPVYVYRLQAAGTFEGVIQNQGLFKEQLATRVVDKKNPTRSATKGTGAYLFPPNPVEQKDLSEALGKDPLVLDRLLSDQTNHILSITPSEIFHIEDNENLTAEERVEAEQMQKDEQLRRRDPAKYLDMMEQRRQALIHQVQQATQVPTTPRSQPAGGHDRVADPDSPLQSIAVPSSSRLPTTDTASSSIALPRGTSAENMPPPTAASDSHVIPALRVERAISTPAPTLHMDSTSGAATSSSDAHIRSSSAGPSSWTASSPAHASERLDKQLLDKQLLVSGSSPVFRDRDAEILNGLKNAVANLFRHTNASSHESLNETKAISETTQNIAKEDFFTAMSAKGFRNPILALAEATRNLYAQELSHIIFEMSSNDAEYHHLVAGVKELLERDEVKPKHLVKVMMEKHNPITGFSTIGPHVDVPKKVQITTANAGKVQANGKNSHKRKANGELESKEGSEDFVYEWRPGVGYRSKKSKSATNIGPNFKNPSGRTEQQFLDLLQKEADSSSLV